MTDTDSITLTRAQLMRACGNAGIPHTTALRIMAYLPPLPVSGTCLKCEGRGHHAAFDDDQKKLVDVPCADCGALFVPRWDADLQYRRFQEGWPKPWRARQITNKNERQEFRRVGYFDTLGQALAFLDPRAP